MVNQLSFGQHLKNVAGDFDTFTLANVLTPIQIASFKSELERIRKNPSSIRERAGMNSRQNRLFLVHKGEPFRSSLESLLRDLFPFPNEEYQFYSINFYHLEIPYSLHCDSLGPEKGYYQAVIPLEVSPFRDVYTIVFDQTADIYSEWIAPIYNKPPDYQPFRNKPIYDARWFRGWSDEFKISESDGHKFWGATWDSTFREAYKGFSIKKAYKWNVGDIFVFDSRFTHCASELKYFGIEMKMGLLICLERVATGRAADNL